VAAKALDRTFKTNGFYQSNTTFSSSYLNATAALFISGHRRITVEAEEKELTRGYCPIRRIFASDFD